MSDALTDALFEVLFAHQRIPTYQPAVSNPQLMGNRCVGCDHLYNSQEGSNSPSHTRHLAEALVPVVARFIEDARKRNVNSELPEGTGSHTRTPDDCPVYYDGCHCPEAIEFAVREQIAVKIEAIPPKHGPDFCREAFAAAALIARTGARDGDV